MKKLILSALSITVLFTACQKKQNLKIEPEIAQTVVEENALTDARILSKVKVKNGTFYFKDRKELVDLACYLTNLKMKPEEWKNYYRAVGVTPLEYRYDEIDAAEVTLGNLANKNKEGNILPRHSVSFMNNLGLYKKLTESHGDIIYTKNLDWLPLSLVINSDFEFFLENEKCRLVNGKVINSKGELKLIHHKEIINSQSNKPNLQVVTFKPPCYGGPSLHSLHRIASGAGGAGYSPYWTATLDLYITYVYINPDPCNTEYKIILESNSTITRHATGNQNGVMIHSGSFKSYVNTLAVYPNYKPIIAVGQDYYFPSYGVSTNLVLVNQTFQYNNSNQYNPAFGIVKIANWHGHLGFSGGPSGGKIDLMVN